MDSQGAEFDPNDPSVKFGTGEALTVFNIARDLEKDVEPAELQDRELEDMASNAVRAAIRHRYNADIPIDHIDIAVATAALVDRVLRGVHGEAHEL